MADLHEHPDGDPAAGVVLPRYGDDGRCLTDFGADPAAGGAGTAQQRQIEAIAACPPGPELDAWLRGLDLSVLPAGVVLEVVAAWDRMESSAHAGKLAAVAELVVRPTMDPDRTPGRGAAPVGRERVVAGEVGMRLRLPVLTASRVVRDAVLLDGLLQATGAALASGHVDARKADTLVRRARDLPYEVSLAVEDAVLPDADQCSHAQFEQRVEHAIALVDAEGAALRHATAREGRRVTHPRRRPDGMAAMWCVLSAPDAARLDGVLDHTARAARALGDPRTLDQLRADGLRDLVVGDVPAVEGPAFEVRLHPPTPRPVPVDRAWSTPGGPTRPMAPEPTATITPIPVPISAPEPAPAAAAPAEAGALNTRCPDTTSTPVPAAPTSDAADLAARAHRGRTTNGCGTCGGRPGAQVRVTIAASTLLGLDDQPGDLEGYGAIDAVTARALAAGGDWQRIVTDPLTEQTLDIGRRRYRPPAALDEHVRVRDKTCAAPGCTVPATRTDLDHTIAYHPQPGAPPDTPLGGTDAGNLGPLCRAHHRLKTVGGFRLRQIEPGLFEWITPTGHRYLVRPGTGRSLDTTTVPHDAEPPF
ncbi:hypothetical protein CHO01_19260 [Cellulomonas hominis]|uniref:DUF222 domain-containing protein n=1 Tax=Cellulomonas hominis TaxID=156981 RepID=A0A511FC31_9CELL|nr:HNH endonuclease signature motif containing protein [Cellulomonas hominis]MBB5475288.1 hypothetical protein [Cellulomonas hominis]GEL46810.1 hypothetical protein CHO01_19260 [Cellulomonas hominis]